jgi:hypothetical protein
MPAKQPEPQHLHTHRMGTRHEMRGEVRPGYRLPAGVSAEGTLNGGVRHKAVGEVRTQRG